MNRFKNIVSVVFIFLVFFQYSTLKAQLTFNKMCQLTISEKILSSFLIVDYSTNFETGTLTGWNQVVPDRWAASVSDPISGTYSLKHIFDNSGSATDVISLPIGFVNLSAETKSWRFQVKYQNSDPSSSNNFVAFLSVNNPDVTLLTGVNGYAVGVNLTGTDDLLKLYKINNGTVSTLITTTIDWKNIDETSPIGIVVTRTTTGGWTLQVDLDGGFDYLQNFGSATDNSFTTAANFALRYKYTSTLDNLLWLDDLYIGAEIPDTDAPFVKSLTALSSTKIQILFNEALNLASAENVLNYTVNAGIGNPVTAVRSVTDPRLVDLTFSQPLSDDFVYTLTINGVSDILLNPVVNISKQVTYTHIKLVKCLPASASTIDLVFNKDVTLVQAQNVANYKLNTNASITGATRNVSDFKKITLTLGASLTTGKKDTLQLSGLTDTLGNVIFNTNFIIYTPKKNDLVITELMIDVNPAPAALPVDKYIEIKNLASDSINLYNMQLRVGSNSSILFPDFWILPGQNAIICAPSFQSAFSVFGKTIPVLSSSQLTSTTSQQITLKNVLNAEIESITYDFSWYNNTEKDDGGWSLERIDESNFCNQFNNWTVTLNAFGGTPGTDNSVKSINKDITPPVVEEVIYRSSKQINVRFSEYSDSVLLHTKTGYLLNNTSNPSDLFFSTDNKTEMQVRFPSTFSKGQNMLIINSVADLCGNVMLPDTFYFTYTPIAVSSINVLNDNQLKINFTDFANTIVVTDTLKYIVDNQIEYPSLISFDNYNNLNVYVSFEKSFTPDTVYKIGISGIFDSENNPMPDTVLSFIYHLGQPNDIVFSEIMADISPVPNGLPDAPYVELYNRSEFPIALLGWKFVSGTNTLRLLPDIKIEPKSYMLLVAPAFEIEMDTFGTVIPVLSSSDLTISGKQLYLISGNSDTISSVNYNVEWYNKSDKEDGGWSLEKIDLDNFCGEQSNWLPSVNSAGGTPGASNSVAGLNPDTEKPFITNVIAFNSKQLHVFFNKLVPDSLLYKIKNYRLNDTLNPVKIEIVSDKKHIALTFANPLNNGLNTLQMDKITDYCLVESVLPLWEVSYKKIYVQKALVISERTIQVQFSEIPDFNMVTDTLNYELSQLGYPAQIIPDNENATIYNLVWNITFTDNTTYSLSIGGISDLLNNTMDTQQIEIIYNYLTKDEVQINELLFNAFPYGADYIELYNNSEKPVNVQHIVLANNDIITDEILDFIQLSTDTLIQPKGYVIVTSDTANIKLNYLTKGLLLQEKNLFSMDDKSGKIKVFNAAFELLDQMVYNDSYHFPLLNSTEGIALERVSLTSDALQQGNWQSATANVGFGTPGYENSQTFDQASNKTSKNLKVNPEYFTPDNDGLDDILYIWLQAGADDYSATVTIYNAQGMPVITLAENSSVSGEAMYAWQGTDTYNHKCSAGIYVIYVQMFNVNGQTKQFKGTCVLGMSEN